MSKTITIRTDESLRNALEERALKRGVTLSEAAREILQDALEQRPLGKKTAYLRGSLKLDKKDSWREKLRGHNWRS